MVRLKIKTCVSNAISEVTPVGLIINGFGSRIWMVYVDQCFTQLSWLDQVLTLENL